MTRSGTVKRLALVLGVTSILAACSSGGATTAPSAAAASAAAPSAAAAGAKTYKDLTIGFIQTGSESGWRAANTASFKETATQLGINLKFYDAQNKLENQVSAFHQFNQDPSVNVIILAALDVTGYDDVLKEAKAAGKVVVLEDRRIDADPSLYYTYIGSDFDLEGQKVAAAMCDLLKDSPKKNVVEISGAVGASAAIDRAKGFREKMDACGITITATQTGNWGVPESKAVMAAWLKDPKIKDIQGVFGHNDEEAIGAIQAIKEQPTASST
jgi:ABC-type sugar transport system substrate-binding protein